MGKHGVPGMGKHGVPGMGKLGVPGMGKHGVPRIRGGTTACTFRSHSSRSPDLRAKTKHVAGGWLIFFGGLDSRTVWSTMVSDKLKKWVSMMVTLFSGEHGVPWAKIFSGVARSTLGEHGVP